MPQLSLRQPPPQSSAEAIEGELRHAILSKLTYELGKSPDNASDTDWYQATALAVRDRIVDIWMKSRAETENKKRKRVYYLSIEFLIGRLLLDTLTNLRLVAPTKRALESLGVDFDRIRAAEPDAALGNGGLGRLAACFMDSMAALAIPAYGYGIRYENGLFEQRLHDGWQQEWPEDWLARHPSVTHVIHPSQQTGEARRRADAYLKGGYGALLGFELKGGVEAGRRFIDSLKLLYHVANIGDTRSLAIHPASTTHSQLTAEEQLAAGVTQGYVRLSIGIEHVDDIIADLDQALAAASVRQRKAV